MSPPEDIVAMSSPTSNAPGCPPMLDLNVISVVEMEVFIPLEQINPHEMHEDELMNEEELMEQEALFNQ